MNTQDMIVKAVDAVCEASGRTNTATGVVREFLSAGDFASCGAIATRIRAVSREKETEKRRMQILRVLTQRVAKELELGRVGYKLDKKLDVYECVTLAEVEKVEKDKVLAALELVLNNLDRADIVAALRDGLISQGVAKAA